MSAERDELLRLVRELPEDQVPVVLSSFREHLTPVRIPASWPPPWFGSVEGDGSAVGARAEELLDEGFGR